MGRSTNASLRAPAGPRLGADGARVGWKASGRVRQKGLSIGNGLPIVGDMCMGNALHVNGTPYAHAATEDEKAIEKLTRQKRNDYPELVA